MGLPRGRQVAARRAVVVATDAPAARSLLGTALDASPSKTEAGVGTCNLYFRCAAPQTRSCKSSSCSADQAAGNNACCHAFSLAVAKLTCENEGRRRTWLVNDSAPHGWGLPEASHTLNLHNGVVSWHSWICLCLQSAQSSQGGEHSVPQRGEQRPCQQRLLPLHSRSFICTRWPGESLVSCEERPEVKRGPFTYRRDWLDWCPASFCFVSEAYRPVTCERHPVACFGHRSTTLTLRCLNAVIVRRLRAPVNEVKDGG